MAKFNYQQISEELISLLPQKQKEIIARRFGLGREEKETLEAIGQSYGICRERVRQIEKASLDKMKKKTGAYKEVFKEFSKYLKALGGARKEEGLLDELGEGKWQTEVYFLLSLSSEFKRVSENEDYHSFWMLDENSFEQAKVAIAKIYEVLKEKKSPASLKELSAWSGLKKQVAESYVELSKKIAKNQEGKYGLKEWPEINPKGIKDKIYLLFKKFQKPFHFTDVAKQIPGSLVQTVHNELIRDSRFVLIGRGVYALKEWGYSAGDVKDVILKVIREGQQPLAKQEIIDRVLKQRLIKENTVLMNLSNKKYFKKDSEGKYWINEA